MGYTEDGSNLTVHVDFGLSIWQGCVSLSKTLALSKTLDGVNAFKKEQARPSLFPNRIFQSIISGNSPEFSEDQLINGEQVWITPEEKEKLESIQGWRFRIIWTTNISTTCYIGQPEVRDPRYGMFRPSNSTRTCGLWFAAQFDSDETQQKIETLLRVLGDTGIGGERNAGYGMFNLTETTLEMPSTGSG